MCNLWFAHPFLFYNAILHHAGNFISEVVIAFFQTFAFFKTNKA
jgi:hypothetical protein